MGALTGFDNATVVRRANALPIGEVYKNPHDGLWKAYTGYEAPTECLGSHDYKIDAVASIHRADREYRGVGEFEGAWKL